MVTGSLPGVKRPGRGADHPPPSSAEVKKEYSYNSTHPLGHFRPVTGQLYLYLRWDHYVAWNVRHLSLSDAAPNPKERKCHRDILLNNQPTNQTNNQPTNQPTNQIKLTHQPIKPTKLINQPTNQTNNQQPTNQPNQTNPSTNQTNQTNQPANQPNQQPTNQPTKSN
jgi:hypothetical protein